MRGPLDYESPPADRHERARRAGLGISLFLGFCGGLGTGAVGLVLLISAADADDRGFSPTPASVPRRALLRACLVFAAIGLGHFGAAAYAYRRGYRGYLLGALLGFLLTLLPLGICFMSLNWP